MSITRAIDEYLDPAELIAELVNLRSRREAAVFRERLIESILRLQGTPVPDDPHPPLKRRTTRRRVRR